MVIKAQSAHYVNLKLQNVYKTTKEQFTSQKELKRD